MPSRATEIRDLPAAANLGSAGAEDVRIPLTSPGSLNVAWSDRFVAALHAAGVRDVVISPGSRSGPLALAFDRSSVATHVSLDERSAGYFALGLAKASRRPAALVCTSGTAAANYFPALVEARYGRVPLIVATADRPPELRDTGAPQTIDQIKLFGDMVRWFVEVGTPDASAPMLEYAASLGTRAAAEAWRDPAGPVHLNFSFREPLLPDPEAVPPFPPPGHGVEPARDSVAPARDSIRRLAGALRPKRRGLIVCGPDDPTPEFAPAVTRLARLTGYPVLADAASQVRFGAEARGMVIGSYDAFLRSPRFAERNQAEVILQFGAALTSKAYHLYASWHPAALHVIVDRAGGWRTPGRSACEVVCADPAAVAHALCEALADSADPLPSWSGAFERAERTARAVIERRLARSEEMNEARLLPQLLDALPDDSILYIGNSMAIRDLDAFAPTRERPIRVLANRGANGIDGVLSSALGASAASERPLLAVLGDLSFHHDWTALHMTRDPRVRATIVVVQNDGGAIFSFLPVARHAAFERYFGTPHGLDFAPAAAMYGITYSKPKTWGELTSRARESLRSRATEILEVRTDREGNRALHQAVWEDVVRAVEREVR